MRYDLRQRNDLADGQCIEENDDEDGVSEHTLLRRGGTTDILYLETTPQRISSPLRNYLCCGLYCSTGSRAVGGLAFVGSPRNGIAVAIGYGLAEVPKSRSDVCAYPHICRNPGDKAPL
jgi:hypothetical protein